MKTLAIIPARGGSKRIPRKNIRLLSGHPIMHYSVRAALESGCFDEIMVSTEDAEIAEIATGLGVRVPFLRSEKTAGDFATTADVVEEVLTRYEELGIAFDLVCCIYPTAALVTSARLREGRDLLLGDDTLETVMPVLRYGYPIQRVLRMDENQRLSMISPEFLQTRSQDLEAAYHDAGQWYWIRAKVFRQTNRLISSGCAAVILPDEEAQDIDSEDDWKLAELKMQLRESPRLANQGDLNMASAGL